MCEECGERPAAIRYTEVIDGELSTWNLCDECARRKGVTRSLTSLAAPLVNILMGLLEESREPGREPAGSTCPQCGLSYAEFRRSGRLGCGMCYRSFHDELRPLLRRIHGSTEHVGGVPTAVSEDFSSRRELHKLRRELDRAVRHEEYERAAELRDLIKAKEEALAASAESDVDVRNDDE